MGQFCCTTCTLDQRLVPRCGFRCEITVERGFGDHPDWHCCGLSSAAAHSCCRKNVLDAKHNMFKISQEASCIWETRRGHHDSSELSG